MHLQRGHLLLPYQRPHRLWSSRMVSRHILHFQSPALMRCDPSDYSLAIHDTYPEHYPLEPNCFPSIPSVLKSVITAPEMYDTARLDHLKIAIALLRAKSKSFYVASLLLDGKLKLDLLSLYVSTGLPDPTLKPDTLSPPQLLVLPRH